jgi:hypothetical protein
LVVNDGNKPSLIVAQTMCYVICHYVSYAYDFNGITRKIKNVITYNQQHGVIYMGFRA